MDKERVAKILLRAIVALGALAVVAIVLEAMRLQGNRWAGLGWYTALLYPGVGFYIPLAALTAGYLWLKRPWKK